ncbi:TPA: hypothetical protein PXP79_001610 [Yersinia enterocolitica]|nr:hypothetical protein [Yersinia enterocolitica]
MMSKCQPRDTMSSVVIAATEQMLMQTGESCAHFATERLIPQLEAQGLIEIGTEGVTAETYIRWRSRCIKRTERVITGETSMPADWVITWMSALSEPYKGKCQQKLAALQDLMWIRLPSYTLHSTKSIEAEIDEITRKFGEVLMHAEPAHDGVYDCKDDKHALSKLQNRLFELCAYIKREIGNIESATGISPDVIQLAAQSPLRATTRGH